MHLNFVHAIFFIAFWLLLFMAREDLGLKGILFFIVVWGACVVMYTRISHIELALVARILLVFTRRAHFAAISVILAGATCG